MKTSTTFVKGQIRLGQGKRGPGKVTLAARAALVEFADGNAHRLQGWLDQIEAQDGPAAALSAYCRLLDFAVPRVARQELIDAGPTKLVVTWIGDGRQIS